MGGHSSRPSKKPPNPLYVNPGHKHLEARKPEEPKKKFEILLPYRFDIPSPREPFYHFLDLDSWANAINMLPEKDQMYLQRVFYYDFHMLS
jgi:hypothetical protein